MRGIIKAEHVSRISKARKLSDKTNRRTVWLVSELLTKDQYSQDSFLSELLLDFTQLEMCRAKIYLFGS